jgi:hypothetical protein
MLDTLLLKMSAPVIKVLNESNLETKSKTPLALLQAAFTDRAG